MAKIEDLSGLLEVQQSRILDLEGAAKKAKMLTALIGLGSVLLTAIVTVGAFYIKFNDELRNWTDVKQSHERIDGNRKLYDHKKLNPEELVSLKNQLELPDFSTFALESDIPDVSEFAKITDIPETIDISNFATTDFVKKLIEMDGRSVNIIKSHQNSHGKTFQDTIELQTSGLLLMQVYGRGSRNDSISNAGIIVSASVNGKSCGQDMSFEGETAQVIFYSNVTCVRLLPPGTHVLEANRQDIFVPEGQSLHVEFHILSIK